MTQQIVRSQLDLTLKSDMNTKAKKTLKTIAYQGRSILPLGSH